MGNIRIVRVVCVEESNEEVDMWIKRIVTKILLDEIGVKPRDLGNLAGLSDVTKDDFKMG